MNKAALFFHLADHHTWRPDRSPGAVHKWTKAELDAAHTGLHRAGDDHPPVPLNPNQRRTMSTDVPAIPTPDLKVDLNRSLTPAEGAALRAHAMHYVPVEGFPRPIPWFLSTLPQLTDKEAMTDAIAAQLLTSPDPDRMPGEDGTISFQKLLRHSVTVHDVAVAVGDKESGWAGYLLMDVTVDDNPEHIVANTGAKEAVMRLAIAYHRDELPLTGRPTEKNIKSASGNKPIMFLAEKDFFDAQKGQQVGAG